MTVAVDWQRFELALAEYRRGDYVRAAPRIPGLYAIWGRDGGARGYVHVQKRGGVTYYAFEGRIEMDVRKIHVGWWWSKPLPGLPHAPLWTRGIDGS